MARTDAGRDPAAQIRGAQIRVYKALAESEVAIGRTAAGVNGVLFVGRAPCRGFSRSRE